MKCQKCGFMSPVSQTQTTDDQRCIKCDGKLEWSTEELLSDPLLGLVREVRPGQIALANVIDEELHAPGHASVFAEGGCGIGKAQSLDAPILCPDQWRPMGTMEIGMPIMGRDGKVYTITGVFPQGKREVYRVTFSDGTSTECCREHLWNVRTEEGEQLVLNLQQIQYGLKRRGHHYKVTITEPLQFTKKELKFDPFIKGTAIGNGLHLYKSIPKEYLWSNVTDRIALLQGLCDTLVIDTGVGPQVTLVLSSKHIAQQICFLVQTLGGIVSCNFTFGKTTADFPKLIISLPHWLVPFQTKKREIYNSITRKEPQRTIVNIEPVGIKETQCISTSAPDQLYLTNDCIVTHNTFAYLVPALRSDMRTMVVTAKKSLQDQLESKDVPYLRKKLGVPKTFVSLKGRVNYVCKKQLYKNKKLFEQNGRGTLWQALVDWADEESNLGDLNTFPGETPFPVSTVTAEECTGQCKYSGRHQCGYRYLKAQAKEADLIVTNHSMLGFDLRFGVGRLFNPYNILIVDEAHACPGYLRRAFASEVSETWMKIFLQKAGREQIDTTRVEEKKAVSQWKKLFESIPDERLLPPGFFDETALMTVINTLINLQRDFEDHAMKRWLPQQWAERHEDNTTGKEKPSRPSMNSIIKDCEENILRRAEQKGLSGEDDNPDFDDLGALVKLYNNLVEVGGILKATTEADENFINSRETTTSGKVRVSRQPVNLTPFVANPLKQIDKVIFTSATLNNALLKAELGVTPKVEVSEPSPFNYKANSLIYLPQHLPRPNEEQFHYAVAGELTQLITASAGNALVLFSARTDLEDVLHNLEYYDLTYPIFTQSENQRPKEVMRAFEETHNSVIFGLRSFFEGIDIQGMKLRLVVLVKVPFPHMKDPLCQTKKQRLGGKWWNDYYYPVMLNDVRQAAGRLIRTHTDRGVFAILDVRMWVGGNKNIDPRVVGTQKQPWKGYGHRIFKALPFENFTPNRYLVTKFLRKLASDDRVNK